MPSVKCIQALNQAAGRRLTQAEVEGIYARLDKARQQVIESGVTGDQIIPETIALAKQQFLQEAEALAPPLQNIEETPTLEGIQVEELTDEEIQAFTRSAGQPTPETEKLYTTVSGEPSAEGWTRATRVTRKGQPALVHRGAPESLDINHFALEALGFASDHPSSGLGVFFTANETEAVQYQQRHDTGVKESFYLDLRNPKVIKVDELQGFESLEDAFAFAESLREQGHDGIAIDASHLGGSVHFAVLDPQAVIKPPTELFQSQPVFYSGVLKSTENLRQDKATPEQWLAMIKKQPGVKQEEIEWLGLEEWLKEQGKSVTKQDLVDFINANQIQIQEVEKGGAGAVSAELSQWISENATRQPQTAQDWIDQSQRLEGIAQQWQSNGDNNQAKAFFDLSDEANQLAENLETDSGGPAGATKFASYQLPGGENYRELLLTLPEKADSPRLQELIQKKREGTNTPEDDAEFARLDQKVKDDFVGGHFDEPNILAHIRFNERTDADGNRVLFVEEVQSDWHQKGKKKGYDTGQIKEQLKAAQKELSEAKQAYDERIKQIPQKEFLDMPLSEVQALPEAQRVAEAKEKVFALQRTDAVPDAPFKTTWPLLAMKRMIRYAAENGFDSIAWTTGEQQAERYDLSKQLSEVVASKVAGGVHEGSYIVQAKDLNGKQVIEQPFTPEELPNAIGKELADKVIEELHDKPANTPSGLKNEAKFTGLDLKVGGEGMKGFYDNILPKTVNKYVKKWGGKVGDTKLNVNNLDTTQEKNTRYPDTHPFAKHNFPIVHALEITDKMREAALQGQALFQEKRGSIQFSDNETIINLFKSKNLSTFLHESGHLFLQEMYELSFNPDMPQNFKEDWAKIEDWLGGVETDGLTMEQHEKWARAFEEYLKEGKAPSNELKSAFRQFRDWLVSIYRSIRHIEPLDETIRGIFDRMLATDEQIQQSRETFVRGFLNREDIGMSPGEWEEYLRTAQEVEDKAAEQLDKEAVNEALREHTKAWKEKRRIIRKQVEEEFNNRPEVRAKNFLMTGKLPAGDPLNEIIKEPIKINRQALKELFEGTDVPLNKLPPGRNDITVERGGVHPDEAAEIFGFNTGDQLIRSILAIGNKKEQIDTETDARMKVEFGDMRLEIDKMAEKVIDEAHSDERGKFLQVQLRALNKRTGGKQIAAKAAKEAAQRIISDTLVPEAIKKESFLQAERRSARKLRQAVAKRDYPAATSAAMQEQLNHYLYIEARESGKFTDKALRFFKKFNSPNVRKALKGEHLDQIDQILERYDIRKITLKEVKTRQSLRKYVQQQEAEGREVYIPDEILDDIQRTSYKELTMAEFRGLYDTVKSIENVAKDENRLTAFDEYVDYESAVGKLVDSARENVTKSNKPPPSDPNIKSFKDNADNLVKRFDASLLKVEQMVAWLDGDKPDGPWRKYLFAKIAEAEHKRNLLEEDITGQLVKAMEGVTKEHSRRFHQKFHVEQLSEDFTVAGLISMALNTGNESNLHKLVEGSKLRTQGGWTQQQIESALNQHLRKEDWDFVQNVWDIIDQLYAPLNELQKSVTGTPLKKVKSREVITPYGKYKGGYYPVVYDRDQPITNIGDRFSADSPFDKGYMRATTKAGSVNERIETFVAPIKLDLFAIPRHISEVIQDVTHRRAINDAWRLVTDPRIREVLQEKLGIPYEKQFKHWVAYVANDRIVDEKGLELWTKWARKLRLNASVVAMGFKWTTVVQQPLGITQSIDVMRNMEGGKTYLATAVKDFAKHPKINGKFVFGKSAEMKFRMQNLDRDIRENMRKILGKKDKMAQVKQFAFAGIGYADLSISIPTWIASYRWARDNKYSEQQAIEWADSRVRLSQGTGSAKDLAAVQRNNEFMKLSTMFYSYFNTLYGRMRDAGRHTKSFGDLPTVAARSIMLVAIPAVFSELLSGRGPDDDEEWSSWTRNKILAYPIQSVPWARDFANYLESGFEAEFTPAFEGVNQMGRLVNTTTDFLEGDKEFTDVARQAVKTSGYFLGLPTAQLDITMGHILEVATDEEEFSPFYLFYRRPKE